MAYVQKSVKTFDKGIVDELGDESITPGAASESVNFLDLGDRIELVRGQLLLGEEEAGSGSILGLVSAEDIEGNEYLYRKRSTFLERYVPATETWDTVISGLPAADEMSFTHYRSPAGAFLWASSLNSGLYRINMANPDSYVDLYDDAVNFRGIITIQDNRMWLVRDDAIVHLSWIDNDWPYTAVAAENIGTGDGATLTFNDTLVHPLVAGLTVVVTAGAVTGTDNGNGVISGTGITGTINYTTGAISVTFSVAPAGAVAITTDYSYEQPKSEGLADFTYSSPRTAGQGTFFFQGQGNDAAKAVLPYDGVFYVAHSESIWSVDLTDDDTNAVNKIYRENIGLPNFRAGITTGDGIFFIDDSKASNKAFRTLKYNDISSKVLPVSNSDQLDLSDYNIDDAAIIEYGDFFICAAKSNTDVTYNDTLILYNKRWKLLNKMDGTFNCFAIYNNELYGGSSVDNNVYQIFSGFDDNGSPILGSWTSNDWLLDDEDLKKTKRLVVEGDISVSQELIVEVSLDGDPFEEVGRIAGDSDYVDSSVTTQYGTTLYGGETYGSGDYVETSRYMREFRLRSAKFYRIRVRFRTEQYGYLNVRQYIYRDIRKSFSRVPSKFR